MGAECTLAPVWDHGHRGVPACTRTLPSDLPRGHTQAGAALPSSHGRTPCLPQSPGTVTFFETDPNKARTKTPKTKEGQC